MNPTIAIFSLIILLNRSIAGENTHSIMVLRTNACPPVKVLGSKIYPAKSKEIGWFPITLTSEGKKSSLRFLGEENVKNFHWHGETFDLPEGATLLASTPICINQAFSYGDSVLAIQFHPEVTANQLEQWYIGHTCELGQIKNISIAQLRLDARKYGTILEKQSEMFLNEWLDMLSNL